MAKIIVAYVPVLHEGYRNFFSKHLDAEILYILGDDIVGRFRPLVKDIRRLEAGLMKKAIESLGLFKQVEVLDLPGLEKIAQEGAEIIMPDEDVSRALAQEFFAGRKIEFDSIFLRWDKTKSLTPWVMEMEIDQEISAADFDQEMMAMVTEEGAKTADWWREIGAAVVKNKKVVMMGYNRHVPSEQLPYQNGDPRANFKKGINLDLSTVLHAEARLVAEAARRGISLEGADIYVTDFPCPPCAKLIAYSGLKKLYYRRGYAVLDGATILKSQDVKIIWVKPPAGES